MKIQRTIPSVMFSQHPDHAGSPYWHTTPFIDTRSELEECYRMYAHMGAQEVMWDWEGKLVDEAVVERLLSKYQKYFSQAPLGKKLFLTFRIPNPRLESGYRLGRAFMIMLSAEHLAHEHGLPHRPLFEVILPMTETAQEIIAVQKKYMHIARAAKRAFGSNGFETQPIEVIPIFESVDVLKHSEKILVSYIRQYETLFGKKPAYLRPFCARSDPALNSGTVATTLAIKQALSGFATVSKQTGVPMFPIIAPGALPFRGGLTPGSYASFLKEFSGIRTVVIQSAFRYDYPKTAALVAVNGIKRSIHHGKTRLLTKSEMKEIGTMIKVFESSYRETIEMVASQVTRIAPYIPARRERIQHIGLFGYSRRVGKRTFPRAIGFTACCYSLGIPPEFFGVGKALQTLEKKSLSVPAYYVSFRSELLRAGRYLRKESLTELGLPELAGQIAYIEKVWGVTFGPKSAHEKSHAAVVASIIRSLRQGKNPTTLITRAALLRKSLG